LSRLRYSGRPGTLEEVYFFEVFIFFLGTEEAPFDAEDAPDDVEEGEERFRPLFLGLYVPAFFCWRINRTRMAVFDMDKHDTPQVGHFLACGVQMWPFGHLLVLNVPAPFF
jgi:hypothetical protein